MIAVDQVACGPYTVQATKPDTLRVRTDGSLELFAEERYLVRFGQGVDRRVLRGALDPLVEGEALLRFGNYFGRAELGGRTLWVESKRLPASAVDKMLDEIESQAKPLPFAAGTPTTDPYERDYPRGPDVLYHAYAHLRDAMRAAGVHDLPAAIERLLAHPHEQLLQSTPAPVALDAVNRLDPGVFAGILTRPERLQKVPATAAVATSPTAVRLKGRLPDRVDVSPARPSFDTVPNRFALAVIDTALDIARQFISAARAARSPATTANTAEAEGYSRRLEHWRQHRVFDGVAPAVGFPLESTVLRGRSGYREVTRWYVDLLARSRRDAPGSAGLLERRDAAEIYEVWCYFRVVAAVQATLGHEPTLTQFVSDDWKLKVPWGFTAEFGGVTVEYNRSYSRPKDSPPAAGDHSYSVRLRPDITVRRPGGVHLFDAKLKREVNAAFQAADDDEELSEFSVTFKKADLYKMHTYRDALGAASVWVLYPGDAGARDEFPAAWTDGAGTGPQGVGALALLPGQSNVHLEQLIAEMLGSDHARRQR